MIEYILNSIKNEIDIDETSIQGLNYSDVNISTAKLEVETDNFHENISAEEEEEKDDKEEAKQEDEEEEEEDDDDNNDVSHFIEDEIEIDEKPFQFLMEDFPCNIAVGSVKHIQYEDLNASEANINCRAEDVKKKIDINEGIRLKEELPLVKKEFSNEDAVDPLLPKIEPVEHYCIENSQMESDEFKRFGHLCRLEDLASDVGQSLREQSSNQDDEPFVEGESSNSSGEGRLQLRCLRKYRINRSERGGNADTIQKSKHRNIKAYHCSRCKFTCLTKTRLEDHLQSHGKEKHVCSKPSKLNEHRIIHSGEKPYKCNLCQYTATRKENLKRHIRTHANEKPYTCDICGFQCNNLKRHIRTHTGEKPFKCDFCDYQSAQSYNLKTHIRIHTGEKPFKCDICDYKSADSSTLRKHVRTHHTGEKPYKCNICQYTAIRKANLKIHSRTHTNEKPYTCDICGFKCNGLGHLKTHIRTHTGEKPFKCDFCDYKSSASSTLKSHVRTHHTGEKPFKCDFCHYKSAQSSSLKVHIRTHTGEKPFRCNICDYQSAQLSNLQKHKRKYHETL